MKKLLALIMAAMMTASLASCGEQTSTDGKVSIKIGVPNGDTLTPFSVIEDFKAANPDIEVVLDEAPWNDFMSKIKTQIAGGTAPDIFISDSGYTMTLGAQGGSMDLAEKIETELNADDYISALYAAKDAEGHVWGIPHGLNCFALYYNEALFDEAGLEYPTDDWTFEDVLEAAKKLTAPVDATGASPVYGFGGTYSISNGWLPFVLSTGGAPLDETRTKSNFDDPKTIEGFKHMEEFVKAGVIPPTAWYTANGGLETSFYNGKIAMAFMNTNAATLINNNAAEDFRYNIVSMPIGYDGGRYSVYVPNCWIINGKSSPEKQEAAWKWLKYYLSEEVQLELAEEIKGGFPIHKKAMEFCSTVEAVPANREAFYKNLDATGVTLFENPTWSEWRSKVDKATLEMFEGRADAETVAATAHKEVSEILAE
ncbi:MAG: sugar ABC transporter substrate-binding protein [Clostridia bacterium]|nr:sugar ABC transporter substrate-binding protein [Clostridia bacterium]